MRIEIVCSALLAIALLTAGCSSTLPPPAEGITFRPIVVEDGLAAVTEFTVAAPLDRARAVLMDFNRHADFRPGMLESEILEIRDDNTGSIRFRMRGILGVNPVATCELTLREREGWWTLYYELTDSDIGISFLAGRFTLTARDPEHTHVMSEHWVDAWLITQDAYFVYLIDDAEALRDEMARSDLPSSEPGPGQ